MNRLRSVADVGNFCVLSYFATMRLWLRRTLLRFVRYWAQGHPDLLRPEKTTHCTALACTIITSVISLSATVTAATCLPDAGGICGLCSKK
jgi:hypothetical protein